MIKESFYIFIKELQETITSSLETLDGKAVFKEDVWTREEGGGGFSRIIENGKVFEKGGVNISAVEGELPAAMQSYFKVGDVNFYATGISLVLHPESPFVPTVHANFRYFEMYDKSGVVVDSWFGGGLDLTPYYLFEEDAIHFHTICKEVCDRHAVADYTLFKEKCDEYFHNAHRGEGRGIGGIFYDYCRASSDYNMGDWLAFQKDMASHFIAAYLPIVKRRMNLSYTQAQREWQEIRRGRYVEFNLVHDKGTLFGLKTNGRIESILMSLPPHVQWRYDHNPEINSPEEELIKVLRNPVDWINKKN